MTTWAIVFAVGVYLSLIACLFACIRIGLMLGWFQGLLQLLVLIGFGLMHWLLESWAGVKAPFYTYPPSSYVDMVPPFDWSGMGATPPNDPCGQPPGAWIPACIPISGAIITFCLLWTARLLLTTAVWFQPYRPIIAPFMVALVALVLDGYLDPVLATSMNCDARPEIVRNALSLWIWHTEPRFADMWFSIPLFNFASWYAFPATMVSLVLLLGWAGNAISGGSPSLIDGLLRAVIFIAMLTVSMTAPGANPPSTQIAFILPIIVISLMVVWNDRSTYKYDNPWRWEFVLPMFFYLLYPVAALLFSGIFPLASSLQLLFVTLVLVFIGGFYVVSPYIDIKP